MFAKIISRALQSEWYILKVAIGEQSQRTTTILTGTWMTLEEQINQQRVKHIVSSYQLAGDDIEAFAGYVR